MKENKIHNIVSRINYEDGILYGLGTEVLEPGDVVIFNNKEKAIVTSNQTTILGREVVTLVLLGKAEERFKNDYDSYVYLCSVNDIDNVSTSELVKAKVIALIDAIVLNKSIKLEDITDILSKDKIPNVPVGFMYCKDKEHLEDILRVNSINSDIYKVVVYAKRYPCLITIDRDMVNKSVSIYSININDFREIEKYL